MLIKKYNSRRIGNILIYSEDNQITLHSDRLEIRSLNQGSEALLIEQYTALLGDEDNVTLFGEGIAWDRGQVKNFIQTEIAKWNSGEKCRAFAIYDSETKTFMGSLSVIHHENFAEMGKEYENVVEIGYIFDKSFWGKGYGTEAAILAKKYIKQIIAEASQDSLLSTAKRIIATAHPDNVGSKNILLKTLKQHEPEEISRYGQPRELFFKPLHLKKTGVNEPSEEVLVPSLATDCNL